MKNLVELLDVTNKNMTILDSNIFDHEFHNLINFQLSPYQSITTGEHGEIIFTSDTERENETETFSNFKDLWEKHFRNELSNDLDSYSLKDLQQNEFLSKSQTLLSRLALLDDKIESSLATLMKEDRTIKELDLDNDGVPDRIDSDDTRSVIRTEADKTLVGNKTDKEYQLKQSIKSKIRTP